MIETGVVIDAVKMGYFRPRNPSDSHQMSIYDVLHQSDDIIQHGHCLDCGENALQFGLVNYTSDNGVIVLNLPAIECISCGNKTVVRELKDAIDELVKNVVDNSVIDFDDL